MLDGKGDEEVESRNYSVIKSALTVSIAIYLLPH
jgi:hypothetical protein